MTDEHTPRPPRTVSPWFFVLFAAMAAYSAVHRAARGTLDAGFWMFVGFTVMLLAFAGITLLLRRAGRRLADRQR